MDKIEEDALRAEAKTLNDAADLVDNFDADVASYLRCSADARFDVIQQDAHAEAVAYARSKGINVIVL